ncbi:zinc-binding dehydrogenase [Falsiroseomonas sp. E2-1-a4]|uniref:zinc-binding dehydrogenase n=1 Tax=Falsiroseomonas sp. E2-1-a4 TaxID=3239299 RepID=UPI003F2CC9CB
MGAEVQGLAVGDRVATMFQRSYAAFDTGPASQAVRLPDSLAGQHVAIIGIGIFGAILTRLASDAGAHVIAISRRRNSLEVARRMGAVELIPVEDHWAIIEQVKALTGGEFCHRVIEAVGKEWPLDLAAELTRVRGRLVIAGYHQDGAAPGQSAVVELARAGCGERA